MPHQPEAKLVKKLQKLIADAGGRSFKIHGEGTYQEVGIPDLLCCVHGRFVGIEVKLPGEKLSRMQVIALHEIFNSNGIAAVVETVGQGESLLSYIEDRRGVDLYQNEVGLRPMFFDRGTIQYRFALSKVDSPR